MARKSKISAVFADSHGAAFESKAKANSYDNTERLLTDDKGAAHLLNTGRSTVWRLMQGGELPFVKIGKLRRLPVSGIKTYIQNLTTRCTGDGGVE